MSKLLRAVLLLTFCAVTTLTVNADTFTYTFEAPQFTAGEVTPLVNRAPNVGSASFQASFVSAVAGSYTITGFVPHPLFSGQSLVSPTIPNVLTISFNMPVNQVQFAWAQEFPGFIQFASAAGNQSQNSANVGGFFEGGTFSFSSATSFTSFTLAAFTAFVTFYTFAGQPTLRKLPEAVPHVFLVLVVLTATMFFLRRWRRSSAEFAGGEQAVGSR